jgi:hypothetical protein
MPHLVKWNEELGDSGLAVIGLHVQNAAAEAVRAKAKSLGVRFAVTNGGSIAGVKVSGIPHCVLFDHTGKMVFDGHPKDVEKKLRDAFADMLADETGGKPSKAVSAALNGFRTGSSPAELLRRMTLLRDGSDVSAKEATAVLTRMQSGARARLNEAKKAMKEDPIVAYDAATPVAVKWKGTAIGREAAELAAGLKEKAFATQLKQVEQTVAALRRTAAGAPSTAEAEEILKRLGGDK